MSESKVCDELLAFWFGEEADDAVVAQRQARLWWSKNEELDRLIEKRFAEALRPAANGALANWPQTPRGRLAKVILFDQVTRNVYRGRPQAFAWDGPARQQAELALAAGDEAALRPIERVFLYMPFEHSEDLVHQALAVARFTALCAEVPPAARPTFLSFLDYAVQHRDIVQRFGRFPHRNAILGRPSTAEEVAFLKEPGSSF